MELPFRVVQNWGKDSWPLNLHVEYRLMQRKGCSVIIIKSAFQGWELGRKPWFCSIFLFQWCNHCHHAQFHVTNMTLTSSKNPWKFNHKLLWTSTSWLQHTNDGMWPWDMRLFLAEGNSQRGISYHLLTPPVVRRMNSIWVAHHSTDYMYYMLKLFHIF